MCSITEMRDAECGVWGTGRGQWATARAARAACARASLAKLSLPVARCPPLGDTSSSFIILSGPLLHVDCHYLFQLCFVVNLIIIL